MLFMENITFIGSIISPYTVLEECPANGWSNNCITEIVIKDEYVTGLNGIVKGMILHILWWFDRAQRDILIQSPGSQKEPIGVFAMRSPQRPNPIALSLCEVIEISNKSIFVRGLEALDGSPVVDIKRAINYDAYIL